MSKKTVAIALGDSGQQLKRSTALIANGIIRWARQQNWELLDLRAWRLEVPGGTQVDGLIYSDSPEKTDPLQALVRRSPHSVEIHPTPRNEVSACVVRDWKAIGLQAAEYYLERGFRSFALAAYRTDAWMESLRAFKERIEHAGGRCEAIHGMHLGGSELDAIRDAVRKQLQGLTYPLGIFCANDRLAARLCHWCLEEGIAVPEQAAILGYGNDTMACCSNPVPLSSVNPNDDQSGFEAARLLHRMMDGDPAAEGAAILVPPRGIVTRRSTDITALADPGAARALRYIWDHYMKNIGPDDVASFCSIPRRSLDRRFKQALGRTMAREIMRHRLAKACELLVGTETPACDIAPRVGFRTPQYFNFQFKKHFRLTPQRYRETERKKM